MKRSVAVCSSLVVAWAALLAIPAESEAGIFRKRARCFPCPPPRCSSDCQPCATTGSYQMPSGQPPVVKTIVTKKNRTYRLIERKLPTTHSPDIVDSVATAAGVGPHDFKGTSRKAAKISIVSGTPTSFSSIAELRASSTLAPEATMLALHIPFGAGSADSNRVAEEQKNVTVTAYIYSFKKEPDHDYHVIVGDAPGTPDLQFLNTEIAGLPLSGEFREPLKDVRDFFRNQFDIGNSGPSLYVEVDPPMQARITGSIFFDMDHAPPRDYVGHLGFQPMTAWEIHPITFIEFEPDL
jgi:hypothetical protein